MSFTDYVYPRPESCHFDGAMAFPRQGYQLDPMDKNKKIKTYDWICPKCNRKFKSGRAAE